MDYELAKQLKDAGFPLRYVNDPRQIANVEFEDWSFALFPTLSELIEACGDRFNVLERQTNVNGKTKNGEVVITKVLFIAMGFKYLNPSREMIQCASIEPTEAVAHLWLELNK